MKIKLTDTVDHDGKRHEAGAVLDLPDDQAQALVLAKVAEPAPEKTKLKAEG